MSRIVKLRKANPRLLCMKKLQLLKSKLMKSGIKRPRKLVKIKFMERLLSRRSNLGKIKVILVMSLLMLLITLPISLRIGWHVRSVGSSTILPEIVVGWYVRSVASTTIQPMNLGGASCGILAQNFVQPRWRIRASSSLRNSLTQESPGRKKVLL